MRELIHGLYAPPSVDPRWECVAMGAINAGPILCSHTVPAAWGTPRIAVAWFDRDEAAQLRLLVAEYHNGRRAVLRLRPDRNWNITMTSVPTGPAANWPDDYKMALAS